MIKSHLLFIIFDHITIQCRLYFIFFMATILSKLGKFSNSCLEVGPETTVIFELGYFSIKYDKTPVDKIESPIKFDEIKSIFNKNPFC